MLAAEIAALSATVLSGSRLVPQIRKLVTTGDTSGVSFSYATLGVVSEVGWLTYSMQRGLWLAVPDAAMMTVVYLLLVRAQVRAQAPVGRAIGLTAAWAAALAGAALLGGSQAVSVVLPVGLAVQLAPAVWSAFRSAAPTGVSLASWVMALGESLLWGSYALPAGDLAYLGLSVLGVVAAVLIGGRVLMTSRRSPAALTIVEPAMV